MDNILVYKENSNYYLEYKNIKTIAYVGKNGFTNNAREGSKTTPIGNYELGVSFGKYNLDSLNIPYFKIEYGHAWCDDINSIYYNQLIDYEYAKKNSISVEHLIEYIDDLYEYAIEIKTNKDNIPGKGSAIFIHCMGNKNYTLGCIAIDRKNMLYLLKNINKNTRIIIKG